MFGSWAPTLAWRRLLRALLQRDDGDGERGSDYDFQILSPLISDSPSDHARIHINPTHTRSSRRLHLRRAFSLSLCLALMMLGLLHICQALTRQSMRSSIVHALPSTLTSTIRFPNAIHSAQPVPCHSHNDYWRARPLLDALAVGCTSVEADVWLIDDQLYIGHRLGSVDRNKSLRRMYLDPLLESWNRALLQRQLTRTTLSSLPSSTNSQIRPWSYLSISRTAHWRLSTV